ncbi:PE-PPE domain-containing protein [Mycolicibacterium sp.]|uniref:PE-PPE domain-containing protein n=1 Tax=Mycolicibacterium sp. TaxID=2320850 RepID=UPI003D13E4CE
MSKVWAAGRFHRTAVGAAAVSVAATVGAVAATQPASISASPVDLTALIVVGSSTHPDGAGNENFFGGMFNQAPYNPGGLPGPDLVGVHFLGGPAAIGDALRTHTGSDNAVLSSGWGAANASLLLMRLDRDEDPALPNTVFVLDNNVSRPDGGFGTRYPLFALIGVNPFPAPPQTTAKAVVDIAYQYNYNSNAPADLLNVVAHVNSLVAYLYGYREQSEIELPVDADGRPTVSCAANTCAVLAGGADPLPCDDARCETPAGDRVVAYVTTRGSTTYVTYTTAELPLARLIRDVVPFGGAIADLTEPLLKLIVDSAYYGGNPIPGDPSRYRPARFGPSLAELLATVAKIPQAVKDGLEALSANASHATTTQPATVEPDPQARSGQPREAAPTEHDDGVDIAEITEVTEATEATEATDLADTGQDARDDAHTDDEVVEPDSKTTVASDNSDPEDTEPTADAETPDDTRETAGPDSADPSDASGNSDADTDTDTAS